MLSILSAVSTAAAVFLQQVVTRFCSVVGKELTKPFLWVCGIYGQFT